MLLAEVAGEEDEARVETVAGELADFVAGRILRPVVHEQEAIVDAIVIVRCQLGVLRERGEPGEQHRQRLLLVVTGYENRHGAFVFVHCLFPLMPELVRRPAACNRLPLAMIVDVVYARGVPFWHFRMVSPV